MVAPVAITNGVILAILALCGAPELYLLWVVAWFTSYRLVTRLRSIAEHAMSEDMSDPLRNTRTKLQSLRTQVGTTSSNPWAGGGIDKLLNSERC